MSVRLGVLDQSPIISGHSPAEAIQETVALARLAEQLGYHRYWLAEHHARAALAMMDGEFDGADRMPRQMLDLIGFLDDSLPSGHPFAAVKAQPAGETSPEVWLLGSSDYSGALTAQLGLRFAFAHFISAHGGDAVTRAYRERYEP